MYKTIWNKSLLMLTITFYLNIWLFIFYCNIIKLNFSNTKNNCHNHISQNISHFLMQLQSRAETHLTLIFVPNEKAIVYSRWNKCLF